LPTCITHAAVGACAVIAVANGATTRRFLVLSILSAMLPDIDVLAFFFGIPHDGLFGHRGVTHSLLFAGSAGGMIVLFFFRELQLLSRQWWAHSLYFSSIILMHGVLDAFTNGGEGVAFLAPFNNRRFFSEFTPIEVSPVNLLHFFDGRGYNILASEMVWVLAPSVAVALLVRLLLAAGRRRQAALEKVACREAGLEN
jgi:inner membrane protein